MGRKTQLKFDYPRLYALETNTYCKVNERVDFNGLLMFVVGLGGGL